MAWECYRRAIIGSSEELLPEDIADICGFEARGPVDAALRSGLNKFRKELNSNVLQFPHGR